MNVELTHTPATEATGSAPTRMEVSNAPARNLGLKAMDSFAKVRIQYFVVLFYMIFNV